MGAGFRGLTGRIGSGADHLHDFPAAFCAGHLHHGPKGLICSSLIFIRRKEVFLLAKRSHFLLNLKLLLQQDATLRVFIQHLTEQSIVIEGTLQLAPGEQTIQMQWIPLSRPAGYSARLEIISADNSPALYATTAFDVLSSWTDFPRYGFLTDFSASRADPETVLKKLTRFHINGLQFYDWQYRHDRLVGSNRGIH